MSGLCSEVPFPPQPLYLPPLDLSPQVSITLFNPIGCICQLAITAEPLLLLSQVSISLRLPSHVLGTEITRPSGQVQKNKEDPKEGSVFSPCRLLDYELEMAFFVGLFPPSLHLPFSSSPFSAHFLRWEIQSTWSPSHCRGG
jgi:hypothetical protein